MSWHKVPVMSNSFYLHPNRLSSIIGGNREMKLVDMFSKIKEKNVKQKSKNTFNCTYFTVRLAL